MTVLIFTTPVVGGAKAEDELVALFNALAGLGRTHALQDARPEYAGDGFIASHTQLTLISSTNARTKSRK
jgi:hypothetical protein